MGGATLIANIPANTHKGDFADILRALVVGISAKQPPFELRVPASRAAFFHAVPDRIVHCISVASAGVLLRWQFARLCHRDRETDARTYPARVHE